MKYFFVFVFILLVFFQNNASASCAVNDDWPEAPCFDTMPVNRDEYRKAWAPYYDYKGEQFMEQKKKEMLDARDGGKLAEWMNGGISNHNVFSYYHSRGEVSFPPEYDYFFFEDEMIWQLPSFSIFPLFVLIASIIAGAAALTVVAVRTFKK